MKSNVKVVIVCCIGALFVCLHTPRVEAEELKVGDAAPKFECKDDSGNVWKSADHYGKKSVVVYFYPAAMTGGCTKQACAYRDDKQKLADKDVEVVGVSGDEVDGLRLFKKAHDLNFTLLADTDGSVAKAFGVPLKDGGEITREVDGKEFVLKRGVTSARWTIVVGKDSKIASINKEVKAADDSQFILKLFN
ncbi:MAG: peroxiredoxin [Planctomycetaceae bacterium]|nr:peroxiredoxin [Planctomycetales bacterium]MCB9925019.1 peroxiredoxin [Planctomycetaceae bacterium]